MKIARLSYRCYDVRLYMLLNFFQSCTRDYTFHFIMLALAKGFLARLRRNVKGRHRVSYCSRYLAAVAAIPGRSWRTIARPVSADAGELFQVTVPSHDSLEIRGSRHKSTDLSAPNGTIRPIEQVARITPGLRPIKAGVKNSERSIPPRCGT